MRLLLRRVTAHQPGDWPLREMRPTEMLALREGAGMQRLVFAVCFLALFALGLTSAHAKTRTYFVAADEIAWNYASSGKNMITGAVLRPPAPDRIGLTYTKAVYHEYTDASFARMRPQPGYQGILGPVIRAEVGDTVVVNFKNNTKFPQSMHPHGVFYDKPSEGAPYQDGVPITRKGGDSVAPGGTFRYLWRIPPRAGPAHTDGSSVLWMYHSARQ